MADRTRLDVLLARRGLAESREQAQRMIRAGQVWTGGQRLEKPGAMTPEDCLLEVRPLGPRFVSRGGQKLQAALVRFAIDPQDWTCLDLGASTGGFTDCLLQCGARTVLAVDVGHGQLHQRLREDPRVVLRENVNARHLDAEVVPRPVDLCVADVSFISLLKIIPAAAPFVRLGGRLVVLIKPQFEVGRRYVRKGGRALDPEAHREALGRVVRGIVQEGFAFHGLAPSPLRGPAGNIEYLALFRRVDAAAAKDASEDVDGAVEAVIGEAFCEEGGVKKIRIETTNEHE